ncbi:MAG: DoxX family protein [Pseudomonadota bacterium]
MPTRSLFLICRSLAAVLTATALVFAVGSLFGYSNFGATDAAMTAVKSSSAIWFLNAFLAFSLVLNLALPRTLPRLVFLLALFPLLVGWRIAALSDLPWIELTCLAAFLFFVAMFVLIAAHGLLHPNTDNGRPKATFPTIQLAFIRLYIGLDLVPHFTEKLFAGPNTRADDVASFQQLGISNPLAFVLVAGVIEFAACIGVGLGVFTRLAAVCTVIYLMTATIMGHHFLLGFIWASEGGGWEYPVLWSALILSFVFGGGRWLSVDEIITEHFKLPNWVLALMGDTATHTNTRV